MTEPLTEEVLYRLLHLLWSYRRPSMHHGDSLGLGLCKSNLEKSNEWDILEHTMVNSIRYRDIRYSPSSRCWCMSLSSWQVVPGSSLVPRGQLKNSSASSSRDHILALFLLMGLCVDFHLPGTPGFPCQGHDTNIQAILKKINQPSHTYKTS